MNVIVCIFSLITFYLFPLSKLSNKQYVYMYIDTKSDIIITGSIIKLKDVLTPYQHYVNEPMVNKYIAIKNKIPIKRFSKRDNCEGRLSVGVISAASLSYDVMMSTIRIRLTYRYMLVSVCMRSILHYL